MYEEISAFGVIHKSDRSNPWAASAAGAGLGAAGVAGYGAYKASRTQAGRGLGSDLKGVIPKPREPLSNPLSNNRASAIRNSGAKFGQAARMVATPKKLAIGAATGAAGGLGYSAFKNR